jgi:hypothetical protein
MSTQPKTILKKESSIIASISALSFAKSCKSTVEVSKSLRTLHKSWRSLWLEKV